MIGFLPWKKHLEIQASMDRWSKLDTMARDVRWLSRAAVSTRVVSRDCLSRIAVTQARSTRNHSFSKAIPRDSLSTIISSRAGRIEGKPKARESEIARRAGPFALGYTFADPDARTKGFQRRLLWIRSRNRDPLFTPRAHLEPVAQPSSSKQECETREFHRRDSR